MKEKSVWLGIRRGLMCRCPNCGKGDLFQGFLKPAAHCEGCGTDNSIYPSDDLPPYLTILVVGHIVVGLYMWVDFLFTMPVWQQLLIWLPVTGLASFALLRPMKGVAIGICWATNTTRSAMAQSATALKAAAPAAGRD